MAESLWKITIIHHDHEKLVDMYWVLSGFLDHVQKIQKDVDRLKDCSCNLLEREDQDLYNHLDRIGALQTLPYETWFYSCFAGIISDGSITKYYYFFQILNNYYNISIILN